MSNLNQELEKILYGELPKNKFFKELKKNDKAIAQIKSTILEALVSEMPKAKVGYGKKKDMFDMTTKDGLMDISYNQALADCLEVIKKVLGG